MGDGSKIETPLASPAGFRAIWAELGAPKTILVAVSGGSDSMALMRLAAPLQAADLATVAVATVDHGLRPGALRDAEFAAAEAASLGLSAKILVWTGAKPATGVQEAARAARYRLLVSQAERLGADAIMTAHTADDQAETVFMRQQRRSGPRGLSGMAPSSLVAADASDAISLLRPLLTFRRQQLRDFLTAERAGFIDDPSNENTDFERVRVRRLLSDAGGDSALSVDALVEMARRARAASLQVEANENARFAALDGAFDEWGAAALVAKSMTGDDAALFARLVQAVAGLDHAPNEAQARDALQSALAGRTATLGGAMARRDDERLRLFREPAAVMGRAGVAPIPPIGIAPGKKALWDARFVVENRLSQSAIVRPLGAEAARLASTAPDADAMGVAPSLWVGGVLAALPGESDGFRPLAEERFFRRVNRFH